MHTEDINKEIDLNEMAITFEVDRKLIDKVRNGEITHLVMEINDDNYCDILENFDGNLILTTEELPDTFHGCYFYNNGEFPYAIKNALSYLVLNADDEHCVVRIIDVDTEPGVRFRFQGPGQPSVEDPNGDSCIWKVTFEVVPLSNDCRAYLMRWNPSISSFTDEDYNECFENMVHGMFRMNWSIRDWEEARRGDIFYMLREGDNKAGIVFCGQFVSDPYPSEDWAGSTKRRMYVDLVCMNAVEPDGKPLISIRKLQETIPTVNWEKGHSGELLSEATITMLSALLDIEQYFQFPANSQLPPS